MKNRKILSTALLTGAVTALLSVSTASATPVQWLAADGGNDHWYELNVEQLTWQDAYTEAENRGGYLATVTSAGENRFIDDLVSSFQLFVWLGGSDAAQEGEWFWMTGPEAGQQFWSGGATGSAVNGAYTNWAENEPNDGGIFGRFINEDYLTMWSSFDIFLPDGEWNDATNGGFTGYRASVIEYNPSPVPEPATLALMGTGLAGLSLLRRRKKAA